MCQNTKNMKITLATDICSKGDFVKKRVLTHPLIHNPIFYGRETNRAFKKG